MCEWIPGVGKSPDRNDALVWALTMLDLNPYAGDSSVSNYGEVGYDFASSNEYDNIWENKYDQNDVWEN